MLNIIGTVEHITWQWMAPATQEEVGKQGYCIWQAAGEGEDSGDSWQTVEHIVPYVPTE